MHFSFHVHKVCFWFQTKDTCMKREKMKNLLKLKINFSFFFMWKILLLTQHQFDPYEVNFVCDVCISLLLDVFLLLLQTINFLLLPHRTSFQSDFLFLFQGSMLDISQRNCKCETRSIKHFHIKFFSTSLLLYPPKAEI